MTPKMMRSQLAELVKLEIGRVRRRTSRKQRSITLVVRTLRQWACGTAKKLSSSSKSRSTLATARGRAGRHFWAQARYAAKASRRLAAWEIAAAAAPQRPAFAATRRDLFR